MNSKGVRVDCARCVLLGPKCGDCVVGAIVGGARPFEWDETEWRAVELLADAGLVPRLRLSPMIQASRDKAA